MRRWPVSIVLVLFLFLEQVSGQSSSTLYKIQFEGNKHTKPGYLLNHIHTLPGQIPDSALLEEDLRRMKTLPSVLDAKYSLVQSDSGLKLIFDIEERWTLLPVGDFGVSDDNYWVGAGAMESNAFGRGIYLYEYIQYKTPFTFHAIVRNPYLFGSKWGIEYQGKITEIKEPLPIYEYDLFKQNEHQIFVKYEFVYEKDLLVGIAYANEQIKLLEQVLDLRQSIRLISEMRLQMLDYHYFIIDGWKSNTMISYRLPFSDHRRTFMMFSEFIYFKSFMYKINLASRMGVGISTEQQRHFSPYIIDNYRNIRGSGYRSFRGNRIGIANIELRTTLFENYWGGIQCVAFSDLGFVAFKTDQSASIEKEPLFYAGPGLRIIYKKAYNAVLSIDYGFNLEDMPQGGWVLGWGQYF